MLRFRRASAEFSRVISVPMEPHTLARVTATAWTHGYTREQAAFPAEWIKGRKFWPAVARMESAYGDRNLVCSCLPTDAYVDSQPAL